MKNVTFMIALLLIATAPVLAQEIILPPKPMPPQDRPLVQVALLLDNSGSMSGLIDQARSRLWTFINEFALSKKNGKPPIVQVALFTYGTPPPKMLTPLTDDLDSVSEKLFAITINGGSEHCGQAIQAAVSSLSWSNNSDDLKVIFIAGNEPFTQGSVDYRDACKAAITRGIIVNTIHCGDESTGINTKWKDGALLAEGRFMNINQNQKIVHIESPHDSQLIQLNNELNTTYIAYGATGRESAARQMMQDSNAMSLSAESAINRAATKTSGQYRNSNWDLVDAYKEGKVTIKDLKKEDLPEIMREMTDHQQGEYIKQQQVKRNDIQAKIKSLTKARNEYVASKRKEMGSSGSKETLETAMIKAVRQQAAAKDFKFEN